MDSAFCGSCRSGDYTRCGVYIDNFDQIINIFSNHASFDITRHILWLGDQDSTTGWYEANYAEESIEGVLFDIGAQQTALQAGTYVRLDATLLTADVVKAGDRIEFPTDNFYVVRTVKFHRFGDSFDHRECELDLLRLYKGG